MRMKDWKRVGAVIYRAAIKGNGAWDLYLRPWGVAPCAAAPLQVATLRFADEAAAKAWLARKCAANRHYEARILPVLGGV